MLCRIVGDDDGGKMFTPEEYERYKREVLPMRLKNRLFVSWSNSRGMDCKLVGPETPCFCTHRWALRSEHANWMNSLLATPCEGTNSIRRISKSYPEEDLFCFHVSSKDVAAWVTPTCHQMFAVRRVNIRPKIMMKLANLFVAKVEFYSKAWSMHTARN